MALIPYEPFRYLENIRRDLDRFFSSDKTIFSERLGTPTIDVYETENEVVARYDIPGLEKKDDVNIDIDQNILSVSGTINRTNEVNEENIHRQERFVGRFQRSITLPAHVSSEGVQATYKNGVLEIRMPKVNVDKKRIDVDFH